MKLATLCYLKKNGKTLMMHRIKKQNDMHEGKWNGLGGKIQGGETPEECVIREVEEESGLRIKNPQYHGILTFPQFYQREDWYVFVYSAREFEGKLINSNEGNLKWIGDERLLDLNLWEGDRHFFKWFDKKSVFSAKFIYKKKHLHDFSVVFHDK